MLAGDFRHDRQAGRGTGDGPTSRAMPSSDRQSARFGVSLSSNWLSSRSRYWRMLWPTGASAGRISKTGGLFGDAQFLGRTQHARGLDAAHLGDLDNEIARQLGARQGTRHVETDGDIRRTANDGSRRTAAGIDLTNIQTISIGVLDHFQDMRHDDVCRRPAQPAQAPRPRGRPWSADGKVPHSTAWDRRGYAARIQRISCEKGISELAGNAGRLRRKRRRSLTP
jgi:hypothetical protein